MVKDPSDRAAAVRKVCEDAGGQLDIFYWSFGPDDWVFICDLPDDVTAAAVSVAISGSGRLRNVRTQRLITSQEARAPLSLRGRRLLAGTSDLGANAVQVQRGPGTSSTLYSRTYSNVGAQPLMCATTDTMS